MRESRRKIAHQRRSPGTRSETRLIELQLDAEVPRTAETATHVDHLAIGRAAIRVVPATIQPGALLCGQGGGPVAAQPCLAALAGS